jgi:D-alanine--poly(phosphoribitol) ligase subunit 1
MLSPRTMKHIFNLGGRFEILVDQRAQDTAIIFPDGESFSFQKLNEISNQFARYLKGQNVKKGDVVCAPGIKKLASYALVLGCLKIGAIYSFYDPDGPRQRQEKIFKKCDPKVIFVTSIENQSDSPEYPNRWKILYPDTTEKLLSTIGALSDQSLGDADHVTGDNGAYIMFTSGSTGTPKGVLISHQNLLNFVAWTGETFGISPEDRISNVNPLYFDNSVFDIYASLFHGATLLPFDKEMTSKPHELVESIDHLKCTVWFSVPSLLIFMSTMKVFTSHNFSTIRKVIFGGEGYPKAKLKPIFDLYNNNASFFNVYGPTEGTCICSAYKIKEEDFGDMKGLFTLGKIARNFDYLLLDPEGKAVHGDGEGELCLLGPGLAKGYFNDRERTRAAFVQNPSQDKYQQYIYKTGDIVRRDSDTGFLFFVSRADYQIKHMGYRIELGEIEAMANTLDYVSEAAAIHGVKNSLSKIFLIVASNKGEDAPRVKLDLRNLLPDYMIPAKIFILDRLPKNANGKIDRPALVKEYFD